MRWRGTRFALSAVVAAAAGVLAPPVTAHTGTHETETLLLWRGSDTQPSGDVNFFVSVANAGGHTEPARPPVCPSDKANTECPAHTKIQVKIDNQAAIVVPLRKADPNDAAASITDDFVIHLANVPHYFKSTYSGAGPDDGDFEASEDELGFAIPHLVVSPEPSTSGEIAKYTFSLETRDDAPKQPTTKGTVTFSDNDGHNSGARTISSNRTAEWLVAQSRADTITAANFAADQDDVYLSVRTQIADQVQPGAAPQPTTSRPTTPARPTTTIRRSTATTRPRNVLSPINASTTTTVTGESSTTSVTFGVFPTNPPLTTDLSAAGNNDDDGGPPIAVVISTLGALGALGAVAAIRRYRRSAIDWF